MRSLKAMLCSLCLLLSGLSLAATQAPVASSTALPAANRTFTVGTLRVQQYGTHGRVLVLIPDLSSGPWEWQGTLMHFGKDHMIYALTLAGFDGVHAPSQKAGLLDLADDSLLKLIRTHHIDKPVLIGHSLGGTLAIRFATEHSGLISGVVAVDGLPVFPLLSASQREVAAQKMRQQIGHVSPAEFKAQQLRYMQAIGLVNSNQAKHYAALSARSAPDAMLEYAAEDLDLDLRPKLKNITVPLLEISPYYKPDYVRYSKLNKRPLTTAKQKADYYRQLLDGAPHAQVMSIEGARHFVMLDQPQKFYGAVSRFLSALPKK